MADQDWTSPGGGPGRDTDPPRYGERVPGWEPPTAAPAPAAPQAYAPPPRPGLIPLHPLSFGQLLGAAFALIRYNPRATVAPALIVSVVQNVLVLGLTYGIGLATADRLARAATDADRAAITAGAVATGGAALLAVTVVSVVGTALLGGILTRVVADGALGRRPSAGEALRAAGRRLWPLVGFALLFGVVQLVLVLVLAASVVGLIVAFSGLTDSIGIVTAVLLAIPVSLGIAVVYGFLSIKFAFAPSVIVLERRGVLAAIRRSWSLTRRAFWRTFGLVALVAAMVYTAGQIVSIPFSVLGGAVGGLLAPNSGGDLQDSFGSLILSSVPALIVSVIVAGIGQVAQGGALVLVYLDRRMRTEGLDLELQRAVEQGGDGDPYERIG